MKQVESIQSTLSDFLLRDIAFVTSKNKVLKKGQLTLFKFKDFHFIFTIRTDKNALKTYEMPYPFEWERRDDGIFFSYDIKDLIQTNSELTHKIDDLPEIKTDRLYNSFVVLSSL